MARNKASVSHDEVMGDFLSNFDNALSYLKVAAEDFFLDGDKKYLRDTLKNVAKYNKAALKAFASRYNQIGAEIARA